MDCGREGGHSDCFQPQDKQIYCSISVKLDLSTRDTKVSVDNFPVGNRQLERKKEKRGGGGGGSLQWFYFFILQKEKPNLEQQKRVLKTSKLETVMC